jgi:transposase
MNISVVGIDLAKNVFQLCALGTNGSVVWNRQVTRSKFTAMLADLPKSALIAMEACSSSNYWGRYLTERGYRVALIPAQHVKPFAKRQKNDANDALAICEAATRPGIHFVSGKTIEQQDIKTLRTIRRRVVQQRTATGNQIRALAGEYGVVFPIGLRRLIDAMPIALEDAENGLSIIARALLSQALHRLKEMDQLIKDLTSQIGQLCKQLPSYDALQSIPGMGPLVSAALISEIGDGRQFKNGRQMAAWLGLVPRQHSSGGKLVLGSITKHGNNDLRVLLVHGARAVVRFVQRRSDPLGDWLRGLIARRGRHRAIVALANKLVRIAWSVLATRKRFDVAAAFAPMRAA